MNEPQVLNTLDAKRCEIEDHIGSLERNLEQARRDLSAILAAIKTALEAAPDGLSFALPYKRHAESTINLGQAPPDCLADFLYRNHQR